MSERKHRPRKFKSVRVWVSQVAKWAWEGRVVLLYHVVLPLISVVVVYVVFFFDEPITGCKESDIRLMGLIFQVIGFFTVALGLLKARMIFRKPSIWARLRSHIKRFPSLRSQHVVVEAQGHAMGLSGGKARIVVRFGPDTPLEQRVEKLEQTVESIHDEVSSLEASLGTHEAETAKELATETEERRESDKKLEEKVDEAVVGGIHIEWLGLLFFIAGIVLATAAPEISTVLGYSSSCGL